MKISVVGAGYVGLVTGTCLADQGHDVTCVDLAIERTEKINAGICPFYEPDLKELLGRNIKAGRLRATANLSEVIRDTELTFIAVGTPIGADGIDFADLDSAVRGVGKALRSKASYHTVVIKSTVLPTTTDTRVRAILEEESGKKLGQFGLAMNPEFLREGRAVADFLDPDRIVIGAMDERSFEAVRSVYSHADDRIVSTSPRTAEMIKYAANALLATMISFSNEIARVCEGFEGMDVDEVMAGVHRDRRLSPLNGDKIVRPEILAYLKAGCGFGGSCFPKDVTALVKFAAENDLALNILNAVIEVNRNQPLRLVALAKKALGTLRGKQIAVLGLAFKPDTDDIRESPAIPITQALVEAGAAVRLHDPVAIENGKSGPLAGLPVRYEAAIEDALKDAEAAILITAWPQYAALNAATFKSLMKRPVLVDGRRIFSRKEMTAGDIEYYGIGCGD